MFGCIFQLSPCAVAFAAPGVPSWHLAQLRTSCTKLVFVKSRLPIMLGKPALTLGRSAPICILWLCTLKSRDVLGVPAIHDPGLWQVTHSLVSTRLVPNIVTSPWHWLHADVATISRVVMTAPP